MNLEKFPRKVLSTCLLTMKLDFSQECPFTTTYSPRKKIFAYAKTLLQITIPLSCTHEYFWINLLLIFSSDVSSLGITLKQLFLWVYLCKLCCHLTDLGCKTVFVMVCDTDIVNTVWKLCFTFLWQKLVNEWTYPSTVIVIPAKRQLDQKASSPNQLRFLNAEDLRSI